MKGGEAERFLFARFTEWTSKAAELIAFTTVFTSPSLLSSIFLLVSP
jgi:hypothetical protein